jgi:hypothetical protein
MTHSRRRHPRRRQGETDDYGDDDDTARDTGPRRFIGAWRRNTLRTKLQRALTAGYCAKRPSLHVKQWENHQTFYGGGVHTKFTDETRTVVQSYHGYGDSTIWTGTDLASQAFPMVTATKGQDQCDQGSQRAVGPFARLGNEGFIFRYGRRKTDGLLRREWCAKRTVATTSEEASTRRLLVGGKPALTIHGVLRHVHGYDLLTTWTCAT